MSQPIRVLELRSVRGTGGGPEKTILYGAARSDPHKVVVTVCYLRDGRDGVFEIGARARDMGIDYVEVCERHSFDPAIWPALVRIVRARRIDIVHAHEYKTDFLALALARATGVIPLSTVHGWIYDTWRERRIYHPLDKRLLRWFPRVIAVCGEIRDILIRSGVRAARITTLLNGIDPQRFRRDRDAAGAVRQELGLAPGEVAIGAVGRLEPVKRFDVLLDAFARVRQQHRHVKLFIVGDGSLRAALGAQAAQLGIETAVHFLGHRHDVIRVHHAFDLFAQSSDHEGTPNAVLEAMALETPIVATDAGGTRDLLRDGADGLVVACDRPDALARALAHVLIDRAGTAARVAAARARIETDLSFEQRARTLDAVYADLMAARPERRRAAQVALTAQLDSGARKDVV
jgi:glycosyltransferase involved in cell wall biosynthesis